MYKKYTIQTKYISVKIAFLEIIVQIRYFFHKTLDLFTLCVYNMKYDI